jgi:hypothetical protein
VPALQGYFRARMPVRERAAVRATCGVRLSGKGRTLEE